MVLAFDFARGFVNSAWYYDFGLALVYGIRLQRWFALEICTASKIY